MDKQKAIDTLVGLKQFYDNYSAAFQVALDLLNEKIDIVDIPLVNELNATKVQVINLQAKVDDLEAQLATPIPEPQPTPDPITP